MSKRKKIKFLFLLFFILGYLTGLFTGRVMFRSTGYNALAQTSSTLVNLTLGLHGIGTGGDNVLPTASGNMNPIHPQRSVTVKIYNSANQLIATKVGTVSFQSGSGKFTGQIDLGSIQSGAYTMDITINQYLVRRVPGIVTLTSGTTHTIPLQSLVTGDTDNNNVLNTLDYNRILDCFSELLPPKNCFDPLKKLSADLTNNGSVDQFDYNLFIRELSVLGGDNFPGNAPTPTGSPTTKTIKKWHPGHYFNTEIYNVSDPVAEMMKFRDPKYDNIKGIKIKALWNNLESSQGVYNFTLIDSLLNALKHPTDPAKDKQLVIQVLDRDFWRSCSTARFPEYMKAYTITPTGTNMCYARIWETGAMNQLITLYNAYGTKYDGHPQFEGMATEETAGSVFEGHNPELLTQLIRFHEQTAPKFQKSHIFQYMNWLSSGGGACGGLEQLTQTLIKTGHGMGNPDSVPWNGLPWSCVGEYSYPGLEADDHPMPVYNIYRKYKGQVPIAIGNDNSQLEDPTGGPNTRTFNGEKMDYDGLVKYIYLTFVKGYTYMNTTVVPGAGANYIFWNHGWWSQEVGSSPTYTTNYINAVLDFINIPSNSTITACPTNIPCK